MLTVFIVFGVLYIPLLLVLGLGLCRAAAAADRAPEAREQREGRLHRWVAVERRQGPAAGGHASSIRSAAYVRSPITSRRTARRLLHQPRYRMG